MDEVYRELALGWLTRHLGNAVRTDAIIWPGREGERERGREEGHCVQKAITAVYIIQRMLHKTNVELQKLHKSLRAIMRVQSVRNGLVIRTSRF